MLHAGSVKEIADDCASGIDAVTVRGRSAGEIQLNKGTALLQEAVAVSGAVPEAANDVGPGVQAEGEGEGSSPRRIHRSKNAVLPRERMERSRCICESARQISAIIDAEDDRKSGAGKIHLREDAGTEQEPMRAACRVVKAAGNIARVADAQRLGGDSAGKIDLGKSAADAIAQQPVLIACSVSERADDVIAVVESHGLGGGCAGEINLRESTLAEEEAVLATRLVEEETGNVAAGIDVVGFCGSAVGNVEELEVERGSLSMDRQKRQNQQDIWQDFLEHDSLLSAKNSNQQ